MKPVVFLWSGGLLLLVFFITGIYMQNDFTQLHGNDQVVRYMYRASHIYLLLAAFVLLVCSTGAQPREGVKLRHLMSDGLVLTAAGILLAAFWIEPAAKMESREFTLLALLTMLVGVVFKVLVNLTDKKRGDL